MSTQLNKLLLSNRNLIFKDGRSVSFEQKLRLKSQGFRSRKIRLCASGIEELVQGEALQEAIRIHPVPKDFQYSFARSPRFKQNLEDAINDQINIEYNMSYIYHSMYAFFSRDCSSWRICSAFQERVSWRTLTRRVTHGLSDQKRGESISTGYHATSAWVWACTEGLWALCAWVSSLWKNWITINYYIYTKLLMSVEMQQRATLLKARFWSHRSTRWKRAPH